MPQLRLPMMLTRKVILCVIVVPTLLTMSPTVSAQESDEHRKQRRTVSVSGEGEVRADPDQASIQFSVVTRNMDPEEARSVNADASAAALRQIRDAGVDEEKIRMQQLSLSPIKEWDPETRKQIDAGFEVRRSVSVEIDDLSLVPVLVARIVQNGANEIGAVQYGLSNDDVLRSEALTRAVANAREKAGIMLEELGESLGPIISLSEQSSHVPMPVYRGMVMEDAAKASMGTPEAYAPGSVEITATVTATFKIGGN